MIFTTAQTAVPLDIYCCNDAALRKMHAWLTVTSVLSAPHGLAISLLN